MLGPPPTPTGDWEQQEAAVILEPRGAKERNNVVGLVRAGTLEDVTWESHRI